MSGAVIGIDLGTTNSAVAATAAAGNPRVLEAGDGALLHPSVVSFHPNGSVVFGAPAKQRRVIDPKNTVYSSKRLIGRSFNSDEVRASAARMPYTIKEGDNEQPVIVTRAGEFAVPEISAIILHNMREMAETALGRPVEGCVITCPANFNDAQRSATANAGAIAGLTVLRVLNEPTAAALMYGYNRDLDTTLAVYDFGGGTFDVSILRLDGNVFKVLATAGNSFLGGDDIDEKIVDHMVQLFLKQHRVDLRTNEQSMQRLRSVAEQTKIQLSRRRKAMIKVEELAYASGGKPLDLEFELSQDEFIARIADVVDQTFPVCKEALKLAGLQSGQIGDVVLVGGTTKMPYVRDRVAQVFGKKPRTDVKPDLAVALGAALQATALSKLLAKPRRPTTITSVAPPPTPGSIPGSPPPVPAGPPPVPGVPPPIPGGPVGSAASAPNTAAAGKGSGWFGDEPTTGIRGADSLFPNSGPDAPTAMDMSAPAPQRRAITAPMGAVTQPPAAPVLARIKPKRVPASSLNMPTVQAPPTENELTALLRQASESVEQHQPQSPQHARPPTEQEATQVDPHAYSGPIVMDVIPHSLGIATVAGYCEGLIMRNESVPTEAMKIFATSRDHQQLVRIRVCQGESRKIAQNTVLGDLVLEGLQPRPRGQTKIEVTFRIDASGILNVVAKDQSTGMAQQARLDIVGGQSAEQVQGARERVRDLLQ